MLFSAYQVTVTDNVVYSFYELLLMYFIIYVTSINKSELKRHLGIRL